MAQYLLKAAGTEGRERLFFVQDDDDLGVHSKSEIQGTNSVPPIQGDKAEREHVMCYQVQGKARVALFAL
jgi:hypothetical protein